MTYDEIMQMEAGGVIDLLVAEKVIGLTDFYHPGFFWEEGTTEDGKDGWGGFYCPRCGVSEGSTEPCTKRYSTDIAAAWEVVEKMVDNERYTFKIYRAHGWKTVEWGYEVTFGILHKYGEMDESSWSPSAPLAICRAALMELLRDVDT